MRNNIKLNDNWLSGDGDNEGVYVDINGFVGIGTSTPDKKLEVEGDVKANGELLVSKNQVTISSTGSKIILEAKSTRITIDEDGGITIESPDDITILSDGNLSLSGEDVNISAQHDINISAQRAMDIGAGHNLSLTSGLDMSLNSSSQFTLQSVIGNLASSAIMNLNSQLIKLNGLNDAQPAARVTDQVTCPPMSGAGVITTGSPSVLIGY